ncbi:hypothetical protein GCM10008090_05510 [Arenicella chitinivorans]|uniref:histidine kinase n=1 Tax=Arenicella chitinivorans TaxID=1329800 RepID=A0A918VIB2_9GAMM|nr:ATP-binding protein [Arenicella chitinivorans]GGZ99759.1 hypothetical protein GCM10008090_05510 [Arenicella chitinivorans]
MSNDLDNQLRLARSRAERLKAARDQAETLLEKKSRELYELNQQLELAHKGLEDEVKQATYELSISNQRLQKTLNERLRFIGQMSHEVRTPLNAITGLSELLLKTDLSTSQYDYVDTINSAARSLIVLLNDMLDITKIEAGKLVLQPVDVDTARLHRNLVAMFQLEADQKGLDLRLELDPSLPSFVRLDKGRYRQILNNLVSNAIKNTESGSVRIKLSFIPNPNGAQTGELCIDVVDTGVGIPPEQIEKIFNAYEQLGEPQCGVGLGLAICSQLCALMHGSIRCRSQVGHGSVFEVRLPTDVSSANVADAQAAVTFADPAKAPKPRILVAEDNPINQKVLAAQLAQLGQHADMVDNGAEALQRLQTHDYDLVLMDIIMPIMDGEQTIKAIREAEPRIAGHYCVALTASNYQDQKQRLLDMGFDEFLGKPLSLNELANMLAQVPMPQGALASSDRGHQSAFDSSYFKTQFGDIWETVFVEIADTFLAHTSASLVALQAAIEAGESDSISKIGHSLKGAAASMGESTLSALFEQVEREPDSIQLTDWQEEIEAQWALVSSVIREEVARITRKQQAVG